MKVTCPYCGSMINDTLEVCPNCGSPNAAVRRKSGDQPMTIEELKEWYAARGLPPYETTRFFLGIDCRQPRAFGIYKEENSGNFIVYKNKSDGQRAVRYEGTDEAYAVNEIYLRLKQEILQQKQANLNKGAEQPKKSRRPLWRIFLNPISIVIYIVIGIFLWALFELAFADPLQGYYQYNQTVYYYCFDKPYVSGKSNWFYYDREKEDWVGPLNEDGYPGILEKQETANAYFISEELPTDLVTASFFDSTAYLDAKSGNTIPTGYYRHEDRTYYHMRDDQYSGWYYYDDIRSDWFESDATPPDLMTNATASDFYYTPTWDGTTQITDFEKTEYYENYQEELNSADDYDYDSDYDWDSGDSWNSGSTDWDSDW